jgi:hypothetical protein
MTCKQLSPLFPVFTCSVKRFCGEVRCEEKRFTWTFQYSLRILFSQVLHFDTFRSCDITFIIVLPSSTVLTEMSFDSADRPYWHNITRGNPLALTLSFYARGFERERNAKEKALPSFSQLVQQKIPKAGIRTLHLAHTIQSLCCFTTFSKLIRTRESCHRMNN